MSEHRILVHSTWQGKRVCSTCQTELEDKELFRCTRTKVWHVGKDTCAIKKRTKRAIELDKEPR